MKQHFYVIFNINESLFYIDNQWGLTSDILMAERYNSDKEANLALSYFKLPKDWTIKKVTVIIES